MHANENNFYHTENILGEDVVFVIKNMNNKTTNKQNNDNE